VIHRYVFTDPDCRLTIWLDTDVIDYVVLSMKMAEMFITKGESVAAWTS